jgi:lysophospholipase L1-like esterase
MVVSRNIAKMRFSFLQRLSGLCLFLVLGGISGRLSAQDMPSRHESAIRAFEQLDSAGGSHPEAILFLGSSSIGMWKSLAEDMAPLPVLNRGFGGSTLADVAYYAPGILLPHRPALIVLYAGENDLANEERTAANVTEAFQQFSAFLKQHLPNAQLYYISIKPSPARWHHWEKFSEANEALRAIMNRELNYHFIDLSSSMLTPYGLARDDIFLDDMLHLNETGYAIWTSVLKPVLLEAYKKYGKR